MLRNLGIRSKLLGLVAVPMVLLLAAALVIVVQARSSAQRASKVGDLSETVLSLNPVVHALQAERGASIRYVGDWTTASRDSMLTARKKTDAALVRFDTAADSLGTGGLPASVRASLAAVETNHKELSAIRNAVGINTAGVSKHLSDYDSLVSADIAFTSAVADATEDSTLETKIDAFATLSTLINAASQERDATVNALLNESISADQYAALSKNIATEDNAYVQYDKLADPAQRAKLDGAFNESTKLMLENQREMVLALLRGKGVDSLSSLVFGGRDVITLNANKRVSTLEAIETDAVRNVRDAAQQSAADYRQRAYLAAGAALLGVGMVLWLVLAMARRLTGPVRRLTVAATELGDELPRMVERMQTPGEGPGMEPNPVPVESTDEIGKLASAFNTVNEVTIRVAQEQAALRAGIAEMFVNVARRNQVLLGRQLSFIDDLEHREENPDQLENLFRLDHLATRMRRNAESLLVLAGIDGSRRLRRPMPLSDVIRTAASEIEQYDRVDLAAQVDPPVSGRFALTLAHLLAELLENSTHFSNPDTRVVVSAAFGDQGVHVAITDAGLGMSEEEIEEANEKIAHPPVTEIAVAQRLGFFVVGRLAQRLGATVQLRRGRSAGVIVEVMLPADLFTPGTVPVPESAEEELPEGVLTVQEIAALETAAEPAVTAAPEGTESPTPDKPVRPSASSFFGQRKPAVPAQPTPVPAPTDDLFTPALAEAAVAEPSFTYEPAVVDLDTAQVPQHPVAPAPVAEAPVAEAPFQPVFALEEPVVEAPVVEAPFEPVFEPDIPVAEAPFEPVFALDEPVAEAPVAEAPFEPVFEPETPVAEAPFEPVFALEKPVAQAPVAEAPFEPVFEPEAPVVEVPFEPVFALEEPVAEAPVAEVPFQPLFALEEPAAEAPFQPVFEPEAPVAEAPFQPVFEPEAPAAEAPFQPVFALQEPVAEAPFQPVFQPEVDAPVVGSLPVAAEPERPVAEPVASAPVVPAQDQPVFGWTEPEPEPEPQPAPTPAPQQPVASEPFVPQVEPARPAPLAARGATPQPEPTHLSVAAELAAAQTPPPAPPAPATPAFTPVFASGPAIDILPGGSKGRRGRNNSAPAVTPQPLFPRPTEGRSVSPVAATVATGQAQRPVPVGAAAPAAPASSPAPASPTAPAAVAAAALPGMLASLREEAYVPDMADIAAGAQMASAALAELSEISHGYSPVGSTPEGGGLVRRTPKKPIDDGAASRAVAAAIAQARTPVRERSATEVRGMLSGFRAGVERGRTTPTNPTT